MATFPHRPASSRVAAILVAATLLGGCAAQPVSQVRESVGPAETGGPDASAGATGAPSEPASEPAPSTATSEAPSTPSPTPGIPPKPANVVWKRVSSKPAGGGQTKDTFRITWDAPDGVAAGFRVYGVTECLRDAKQYDGKPCVVKGMRIPKGSLKLLAEAPGSARSADVSWKQGEIPVGPYYAVLIRAYNDAGTSIFTIAWSDVVCWGCTY